MTKEQDKTEFDKVDGPDIGRVARKIAEWQIDSGILRGYLAFVDGVSIGWCNANDKANVLNWNDQLLMLFGAGLKT